VVDEYPMTRRQSVGVAHVAHAQGGGKGGVSGLPVELLQLVIGAGETAVDGRGGAEEIEQQPVVALQVAQGRHVAFRAEIDQCCVSSP
jgi:hypothetical protein